MKDPECRTCSNDLESAGEVLHGICEYCTIKDSDEYRNERIPYELENRDHGEYK